MPTIIEENRETGKRMEFIFPSDWQVVKYDQEKDRRTNTKAGFYWQVIQRAGVKHIQAMDMVCRLPFESSERLQFIEVKDDRTRTLSAGERHAQLYESVLGKNAGHFGWASSGRATGRRIFAGNSLPEPTTRR